jgi:RWD domain
MGRCNNARTRAAAESLRNTPARARFSKAPTSSTANKDNRSGGRGSGRGDSSDASRGSNTNQQQNVPDHPGSTTRNRGNSKMIPAHLVVAAKQKLISKQDGQSNSVSISSRDPITAFTGTRKEIKTESSPPPQNHGIKNVKELEEITLSDSSIEMIFQLLRDLNVVANPWNDTDDGSETNQNNAEVNGDIMDTTGNDDDSIKGNNESNDLEKKKPLLVHTTGNITSGAYGKSGYVEQEDDYDEAESFRGRTHQRSDVGWDDDTIPGVVSSIEEMSVSANHFNTGNKDEQLNQEMSDDPIYQHLTKHLSFSPDTATRACTEAKTLTIQWSTMTSSEQLSKVMDWLCLHLSETELEDGFRRRKKHDGLTNFESKNRVVNASRTTKYKAIPHPSISIIAPNTTTSTVHDHDNAAWTRQAALEDRAIQFLKFGFEHAEIVHALQQQPQGFLDNDYQDESYHTLIEPIDDTKTLFILLKFFEEKILHKESTTLTSNSFDMEEIKQECEVLLAIYEDQFTVESSIATSLVIKRCKISIGSNSENLVFGDLHIFIGPGYPSACTPLFLLYNDHVPWPFLRSINEEMIRRSADEVGRPIIYEMVSQLMDFYPKMWDEYQQELLTKEMEERQQQLCHDTDHKDATGDDRSDDETRMEDLTPAEIKSLSRRQKSKLVKAQKSYDKTLKDAKLEEQRQRKLEQHQERIKYENQNLRQTMADRAILQREEDRVNDALRRVSRLAMSKSLNNGKSIDDARIAARLAEMEYRKEYGMDVSINDSLAAIESDEINVSHPQEPHPISIPQSTPTTRAFMDRLRRLYSDAAIHGKESVSELAEPMAHSRSYQQYDELKPKLPCPVAVSVGDIGTILHEHVLTLQKEQPWLVAVEARVPVPVAASTSSSGQNDVLFDDTQNLSKRQKEVSDRLKTAHDKSQRYPSKAVQSIRQQTRALPAFQMRNEIVSTVRLNQVTLISASTGTK